MHHAFVGRAGPDVMGPWAIAVGVYWTVGRPGGVEGAYGRGTRPALDPPRSAGSLDTDYSLDSHKSCSTSSG